MTPPTQVAVSPDEELTQIHSESQVQEERPSETALTDSQVASEALSEATLLPTHCNRYAHLFPGDQMEYVMTPPT